MRADPEQFLPRKRATGCTVIGASAGEGRDFQRGTYRLPLVLMMGSERRERVDPPGHRDPQRRWGRREGRARLLHSGGGGGDLTASVHRDGVLLAEQTQAITGTGPCDCFADPLSVSVPADQPSSNLRHSLDLRYHRPMIDHTGIGVADVQHAARFYDAALGALGLRRVVEMPDDGGIGYGLTYPVFWIDRFHPHSQRQHTAFAATSRAAVEAFHAAAVAAGGTDNGPPGVRSVDAGYPPGYYAAFVRDLEGNNIEAVFRGA